MSNNTQITTPTKFGQCYRILLATFGGFFLTLIITVFTPELFLWLFGWDKATSLMWMMLLSFGVYTGLIMWIIATKKLLKASVMLLLCGVIMSVGFVQLHSQNTQQTTETETIP